MALPEERREKLKTLVGTVVDEDVLNEYDALKIIDVCIDACEREQVEVMEQYLVEKVGSDEETEE